MILKKDFYFIRHGQTEANLLPIMRKHMGDISLNSTGIYQAQSIEPLMASLPIKTICCSPLKRAKQTKEICCARLDSIHHEIEDLGECDAEIWQRMTAMGPSARLCSEEPVYSFLQKVRTGLNQALSREGPVLIVAHGGVHWAICCLLEIDDGWVIDNCVPVHFTVAETGKWRARKVVESKSEMYSL